MSRSKKEDNLSIVYFAKLRIVYLEFKKCNVTISYFVLLHNN